MKCVCDVYERGGSIHVLGYTPHHNSAIVACVCHVYEQMALSKHKRFSLKVRREKMTRTEDNTVKKRVNISITEATHKVAKKLASLRKPL